MIEQIMIFALGFLFAGVLSLLFLPLFWRRAIRLSKRRLEMQMPLSMSEILAERDQLRAEFAVARRRLEQRAERLAADRAHALAQIGRAAAATVGADERLRTVQQENALRGQELGAAAARIQELEAQFSALHVELHDLGASLVLRTEELAESQRLHRALSEVADERRVTIAGLETRVSGLEMRIADVSRDLAAERAAHAESSGRARINGEQRTASERRAAALERGKTEAEARIAAQAERLAEIDGALGRARQAHAAAKSEAADLTHELALAEERAKALRGSLERQTETRRAQERDHVAHLEGLQSQLTLLKAALAEAQSESADLRRELALNGSGVRQRGAPKEGLLRKELEIVAGDRTGELAAPAAARAAGPVLDRPT